MRGDERACAHWQCIREDAVLRDELSGSGRKCDAPARKPYGAMGDACHGRAARDDHLRWALGGGSGSGRWSRTTQARCPAKAEGQGDDTPDRTSTDVSPIETPRTHGGPLTPRRPRGEAAPARPRRPTRLREQRGERSRRSGREGQRPARRSRRATDPFQGHRVRLPQVQRTRGGR